MLDEMVGFRLSPQQRRLWTLQEGSALAYRAQGAIRLKGEVKAEKLEGALRLVRERHEILRTSFRFLPGLTVPTQVICPPSACRLKRHDWSGLEEGRQYEMIEALLSKWAGRPLDPSGEPWMEAALLSLGPSKWVLLLDLPALCADRPTLGHLMRDVAACYASLCSAAPLAEAPLQYADLSEWLNALQEGDDAAAGRAFWAERDPGHLLEARLHCEESVPETGPFCPSSIEVGLNAASAVAAASLASRSETDLPSLLLSCWQLLLARTLGHTEVVVGVACDGRRFEQLEGALGPLTRYLPLVSQCAESEHFPELLSQVHRNLQQALPWQETFSWELLQDPKGFFPWTFEFSPDVESAACPGLVFSAGPSRAWQERCKLGLHCQMAAGVLGMRLLYDSGLIPEEDARRMANRVSALLAAVTDAPHSRLGEFGILGPEERRLLIEDFNSTAAAFPAVQGLHQLFESQATQTPDRVALVADGPEGRQAFSFDWLHRASARMAVRLQARGAVAGQRVAVCLRRSPEQITALLAILKTGSAYVPLDPANPDDRLRFLLHDCGAVVLITDQTLARRMDGSSIPFLLVDQARLGDTGSAGGWRAFAEGSYPAYVIYTSGSTGTPKGVVVSHQAILNRLHWDQLACPLRADDRLLQLAAFGFDFSVWEIFAPLSFGATLLLPPPEGQDSSELLRLMREEEVTTVHLVPTMAQLLLQEPGWESCRALRRILSGGENLTAGLLQRFKQRSQAQVINQYGPTEATVDATFWSCRSLPKSGSVPIGRPIANSAVYLLNSCLQPAGVGTPGELHIGGAGLAQGYWGRPALTARQFIPDPFSGQPGSRLYRTGDAALHLPEGAIEFLGRLDKQFKIRGVRVEAGDIEAALLKHPAVRQAVVTVREEASGERRLVAYLTTRSGSDDPDTGSLQGFLKQHLAQSVIPSAFAVLSELPLLPSGKTDLRALPAPEEVLGQSSHEYLAPRTLVEQRLAEVWCEVLQLPRVGLLDDFFQLGGHSLLAMRLVSRLRQTFHIDLSLRSLFESSSLEALACLVEACLGRGEASQPAIRKLARGAMQIGHLLDALESLSPESALAALERERGTLQCLFHRQDACATLQISMDSKSQSDTGILPVGLGIAPGA